MAIRAGKQNIPCICVTNRTLCRDDFLTLIAENAGRGREGMVYHGGNVGSFVKTGEFSDASAGGLYDGRSHF